MGVKDIDKKKKDFSLTKKEKKTIIYIIICNQSKYSEDLIRLYQNYACLFCILFPIVGDPEV